MSASPVLTGFAILLSHALATAVPAAAANVTRTLSDLSARGEFRLAQGDAEFAGHGPAVTVTAGMRISADGRSLLADLGGTAQEVGGTTRAVLAVNGVVVYTAEPGARILSIDSAKAGTVSYLDTDHKVDLVCEKAGRLAIVGSRLPLVNAAGVACAAGLVHIAAITGDTNGSDVNLGARDSRTTRTSVEIVFAPVRVTVSEPLAPLPSTLAPTALPVPFAATRQENFGDNGCGASAGWRVLASYGVKTDYPSFLKRMRSRPHVSNILGIGVPPGLLRDALNELSPGFVVRRLTSVADGENLATNLAARQSAKTAMIQSLRAGHPMIALLGWGDHGAYASNSAPGVNGIEGLWVPDLDETNLRKMHFVAVRGYTPMTDTFEVVDNGMGVSWRSEHLLDMMAFDLEKDSQIAFGIAAPDVQPMTVIVKK